METMHLFAGAGGGLLADLILGHNPRIAVEWEEYPARTLAQRAAEGWFENLEVWNGDVRNYDPSGWEGKIHCINAGFPCQDLSIAGKGAGLAEGTRSGLYREVLRIADAIRPRYIFLENSPNIVNAGLEIVIADLAARGFSAEWDNFSAAQVGACHARSRFWLLAERQEVPNPDSFGRCSGASRFQDAEDVREQRTGSIPLGWWENDPSAWDSEPELDGMGNGLGNRLDCSRANVKPKEEKRGKRLKAIGNGQVPLVAAVAFTILRARLEQAKGSK